MIIGFILRSRLLSNISRRGYALVLAAGLMIPGISNAALVSGEVTQSTILGDITVSVTVEDALTSISIAWPLDRWVGISFGPTPAHDLGYMIISPLDGFAYEANADFRAAPIAQAQQDLSIVSFDTTGGISELVLSRDSDTGDALDFQFEAIEQTIPLQWALGIIGEATSERHEERGYFTQDLVLTAVPVPAAVWLFGSGLIGLIGVARRRKA